MANGVNRNEIFDEKTDRLGDAQDSRRPSTRAGFGLTEVDTRQREKLPDDALVAVRDPPKLYHGSSRGRPKLWLFSASWVLPELSALGVE